MTSSPYQSVVHARLVLLLVLFSLSSGSLSKAVAAQCMQEHHDSLLLFKSGLLYGDTRTLTAIADPPPGSKLASWIAGTDCCDWTGVTCGGTKPLLGHVTSLNLSNESLMGKIHPALFNLTSLRSLDLSQNGFYNISIPSVEFKKLEKLSSLQLSDSGFVGDIPTSILNLTSLVTLDLSGTCLKSPDLNMLVKNLGHLQTLRLDGVDVSGPLPKSIGSLKSLKTLSCSSCALLGRIPGSLGDLVQLSTLILNDNHLSGPIPKSMANLTQLTVLNLALNNLIETIPCLRKLNLLKKLYLSFNNMTGSLPEFNSSAPISHISLHNNKLTGSIPRSYSQLSNLTSLLLYRNSLTGLIDMSLFVLPNLTELYLLENKLLGFQGELSQSTAELFLSSSVLHDIHLDNNLLQGTIPHVFFKMPRLKELSLNHNKFTGLLDLCSLGSLTNLFSLSLSGNLLTIEQSSCDYILPNLRILLLASCNMKSFPNFLKNRYEFYWLDFSRNQIEGVIPKWVWDSTVNYKWTTLPTMLNLSHNLLTGFEQFIPSQSTNNRTFIDLQCNMLSGPMPLPPNHSYFINYANNIFVGFNPHNINSYIGSTSFFSISNNKIGGDIPSSICKGTNLEVLDFSNNNFTGSLPACLSMMPCLTILNLQGNKLTGKIPFEFSVSCLLEVLNLNRNMLIGELPRRLDNCQNLQLLDIANNKIVGEFPFWLGRLPNLRILILRSNKFYGSLTKMWNGSFSMLQIVDISSNEFIGSLPSNFFINLRAMKSQHDSRHPLRLISVSHYSKYFQDSIILSNKGQMSELQKTLEIYNSLDFSNNVFEGDIPEDIGDLLWLKSINLSHNHLSGKMPLSLGKLSQLESMDFSCNHLSGKIPSVLVSLHFLALLNLSYNQLVGKIPQGSQFNTFTMFSYIGNKRLCGPPISNGCDNVLESDAKRPQEIEWYLILGEIGFITGTVVWYACLFLSTNARIWLYMLVYMIQKKCLSYYM